MELKDIISDFRLKNKISQREFSRRCDLSNSLISILEMGENPQTGKKMSPDLITYKKLANGMGITVQELFEMLGEDEPISLSFASTQHILEEGSPKTPEARLLAKGIDKMPQAQREQALNIIRAVFTQYANLFDKEDDYD